MQRTPIQTTAPPPSPTSFSYLLTPVSLALSVGGSPSPCLQVLCLHSDSVAKFFLQVIDLDYVFLCPHFQVTAWSVKTFRDFPWPMIASNCTTLSSLWWNAILKYISGDQDMVWSYPLLSRSRRDWRPCWQSHVSVCRVWPWDLAPGVLHHRAPRPQPPPGGWRRTEALLLISWSLPAFVWLYQIFRGQ